MTQADLASGAGLSLRAVKLWEAPGGAPIRTTSLRSLATALRVPAVQLLDDFAGASSIADIPRFLLQQALPETSPKVIEILRKGSVANMQAEYDEARFRLEEALEVAKDDDLDTKAQMIIRLATILDDSGRSQEALAKLEPLLTEPRWRRIKPWVAFWLKYHVALAHRRLAEHSKSGTENHLSYATNLLAKIQRSHDSGQRVAATHQLGCVWLVRAKGASRDAERRLHLKKAARLFETAARQWRKHGNFREGYALARMADIAELQGDGARAFNFLLDAFQVFVHYDCERYRDGIRTRLLSCLQARAPEII